MEEKITSTVQENEELKAEDIQAEVIIDNEAPTPKKKRQLALKIISTLLYLAITSVALVFEIWTIVDSALLLANPDAGLDRLAFIVLIPMIIIIPVASLIAYLIPFIMSIVGFGVSFKKTKKGAKRTGKAWFGVLIALIVITEAILILSSVALILAIKFCQ